MGSATIAAEKGINFPNVTIKRKKAIVEEDKIVICTFVYEKSVQKKKMSFVT